MGFRVFYRLDEKVEFLSIFDGELEDDFDSDHDVYQLSKDATKIANEGGVRILRHMNLAGVLMDGSKVVGGLWTNEEHDSFSFDIAIKSDYQNRGLSDILIKNALDIYKDRDYVHRDMYKGKPLPEEIYVINPKLASILKSKYGFIEKEKTPEGHIVMKFGKK